MPPTLTNFKYKPTKAAKPRIYSVVGDLPPLSVASRPLVGIPDAFLTGPQTITPSIPAVVQAANLLSGLQNNPLPGLSGGGVGGSEETEEGVPLPDPANFRLRTDWMNPEIPAMPERQGIDRGAMNNLLAIASFLPLVGGSFGSNLLPGAVSQGIAGLQARSDTENSQALADWENLTNLGIKRSDLYNRAIQRENEATDSAYQRELDRAKELRYQAGERRKAKKDEEAANLKRQQQARFILQDIRKVPPEQQEAAWKQWREQYGDDYIASLGIGPVYDDDGNYVAVNDVSVYEAINRSKDRDERRRLTANAQKQQKEIAEARIKSQEGIAKENRESREKISDAQIDARKENAKYVQGEIWKRQSRSLREGAAKTGTSANVNKLIGQMDALTEERAKFVASHSERDRNQRVPIETDPNLIAVVDNYDRRLKRKMEEINSELAKEGKKWNGNYTTGEGTIVPLAPYVPPRGSGVRMPSGGGTPLLGGGPVLSTPTAATTLLQALASEGQAASRSKAPPGRFREGGAKILNIPKSRASSAPRQAAREARGVPVKVENEVYPIPGGGGATKSYAEEQWRKIGKTPPWEKKPTPSKGQQEWRQRVLKHLGR